MSNSAWIPISSVLPKVGELVHVVANGVMQQMPCRLELKGVAGEDGKEWIWLDEDADPMPFELVTHYQPLPKWEPTE